MDKKILVSVNSAGGANWQQQLEDIQRFNITEFALFLSTADKTERSRIFHKLETISNITIPFIHARDDMETKEYEQYIHRFNTRFFNLHSKLEFPHQKDIPQLKTYLLLENTTDSEFSEAELNNYAGICFDSAHFYGDKVSNPNRYQYFTHLLEQYPILANHVSGFTPQSRRVFNGTHCHDIHTLEDLHQLDYLKDIPKPYFSPLIAFELSNDIKTQLEVKEYFQQVVI